MSASLCSRLAQEVTPISKLDELFAQVKQNFLDAQVEYPEDFELNCRHAVQRIMEALNNMDLVTISKEHQELMSNAIQKDVAVFSSLRNAVQDELSRRLNSYIEECEEEIVAYLDAAVAQND